MSKPIGNLIVASRSKLNYFPCAVGRARYFGEPVAVVMAENRYIAEDALDLIEVDYAPAHRGDRSGGSGAPRCADSAR